MNTATLASKKNKLTGSIFYDAECRFCVGHRLRWGRIFERRGFLWLPLQTPGTEARLGITESQLQAEMWLQLADGRKFSGVDAWSVQMRYVWWLWPLGVALAMPGLNALARAGYRWIARHRHCLGGACAIPTQTRSHPVNGGGAK